MRPRTKIGFLERGLQVSAISSINWCDQLVSIFPWCMCVGVGGWGEKAETLECIKPEALSLISRRGRAFSRVFSCLLFISLLNLTCSIKICAMWRMFALLHDRLVGNDHIFFFLKCPVLTKFLSLVGLKNVC